MPFEPQEVWLPVYARTVKVKLVQLAEIPDTIDGLSCIEIQGRDPKGHWYRLRHFAPEYIDDAVDLLLQVARGDLSIADMIAKPL